MPLILGGGDVLMVWLIAEQQSKALFIVFLLQQAAETGSGKTGVSIFCMHNCMCL